MDPSSNDVGEQLGAPLLSVNDSNNHENNNKNPNNNNNKNPNHNTMVTTDDTTTAGGTTMEGNIESSAIVLQNQQNASTTDTTNGNFFACSSLCSCLLPSFSNPHQLTAMISNFSTSYNVVNISLVLPILEHLYENSNSEDAAACASSLLAGMILGQLLGGILGDSVILGRLGALRLVMALQIIASLASASVVADLDDDRIYMKLAVWRFILGIGAGGVYPLAAVLSAEQGGAGADNENKPPNDIGNNNGNNNDHPSPPQAAVEDHHRSVHRVVLTFSTQGAGFVSVPIVTVILLYCTKNLNLIWRIILGMGSLPGIILMFLQWQLYSKNHSPSGALSGIEQAQLQRVPLEEEPIDQTTTEQHTHPTIVQANGDEENATTQEHFNDENDNENNFEEQPSGWFSTLRNEPGLCRKVIGTAGTWFLFDVVFYGNAIFQPIVVEAAFGGSDNTPGASSAYELLRKAATDTLILTSIALPGYAVAGLVIGKRTYCVTQTPRYVMLQGFAAMSILYSTIGLNWSYLRHSPSLLVFLYGMTFFFANYGPNTCTFILPSLIYSPECRTTWNGISAASGKLGALFGATLFAPAADKWGDSCVMLICASLAVFAFVLTYCFVPKDGEEERQQHEILAGEDDEEHDNGIQEQYRDA